MAFDVEGARKAGYGDDEIADFLGRDSGLDVSAARKAGYNSAEVIDFVLKNPKSKEPVAEAVSSDAMGTGGSEIMAVSTPSKQTPTSVLDRYNKDADFREQVGELERPLASTKPVDFGTESRLQRQIDDEASRRNAQIGSPSAKAMPEIAHVKSRTFLEAAKDTGAQLAEGVNTMLGAPFNLVAPEGGAAEFFNRGSEYWQDQQSDVLKGKLAAANKSITAAGEDGLISQVAEAASQYFTDPALAARFVTTNLPSMIPGVASAKLAQAAALARGATAARAATAATATSAATNSVMNAGGARGEAFKDIKETLMKQGMSEDAATEQALRDSRVVAAVGAVTGAVSGKTGLEKTIVSGAAKEGGKSAFKAGVKSVAAEAAGEQLEEVAPNLTTNIMAGQYDNRPVLKDVGRTIVETAIGAGPGSILSGVSEGVSQRRANGETGSPAEAATIYQIKEIATAQTTDEAIAAASQALDAVPAQSVEAVANIGRILEEANASRNPAIPAGDTTSTGSGLDNAAPSLGARVGDNGASLGAVDTGGKAAELPAGNIPQAAEPNIDALRTENATLRSQAVQELQTQQVTTPPAGQVPAARGDESTAQLPAAGTAQVEAGGVAAPQSTTAQPTPALDLPASMPAETKVSPPPATSARQVAIDAEKARMEAKRTERRAAAKEAAKPMEGLSVGSLPTNAEPVTVKDGVVYIGKYPAQNFDTGADVTVSADATPQQIAATLKESGALGKRSKFFGLPTNTSPAQAPQKAESTLASPEQQRADFKAAEKARTAPGNSARGRAHEANPFKAFIAKHGISAALSNEFAPGRKERQAAMVQGYGPVFRKSGLQLDTLAELAVQDGYLTTPDVTKLSALISDVLRGKRVIPQFAEGAAETEMEARAALEKEAAEEQNAEVEAETKAEREAIQALAELSDESLLALASDDAVLTAGNNVSEAEFLRALGATEQEIEDATQGQERKGQDAESRPGPQEAAAGAAPRGAESRDGEARADDKGLTAPTRADIEAKQDRAEAAPARDQREQIRKESEAGAGQFELTQEDGRQDTTGNLFDQPASQLSAAQLLRAAADKMEGKAEKSAAKPSKEEPQNPMFSRSSATAERDLIVQHNLTAENLVHAYRMGGIAAPSVAITKADRPLNSFGEITLIGDKSMADPKNGLKVFGADIYSPRYPSIEYKLGSSALKALNAKLQPFLEGGRQTYSNDISRVDDLTSNKAFQRFAADHLGADDPNSVMFHDLKAVASAVLSEVGADERIFHGYTYSGNRRYIPHTLENVVKILKKELRGGENFSYGVGSVRSHYAPQFRSLDAVRKEKNRLVTKDEFKQVKKEVDDEFFKITDSLSSFHPASNTFGYADAVALMMSDSAKMGVPRALQENGFKDVPPEAMEKVRDYLKKLRNLPTEYFEGKMLRSVGISEFKAAVVPEDTKKEVLDIIENNGLRVFSYKKGDDADRIRAIRQAANETEDSLFSKGQLPAVINTSSVASVNAAITDLLGSKQLASGLGRIVATTSAEIKSKWEPLIGHNVQLDSEDEAGTAQGFYDPGTKTIFLIADNIPQGAEQAVLAHELMHKHGQDVLGKAGWDRLHSQIGTWKDAPEGSDERRVYDYADGKVAAVGDELSNQELFPYAVEAAIRMGVKPSLQAKRGTVENWLESVRQSLKSVWGKITGKSDTFKAQDMVDLAFGIAQMENQESAGAIGGALTEQTETPAFKKAAQAALKAANNALKEQAEFDVQKELKEIEINGNGAGVSDLIGDPKYWNAEDEEMTPAGQEELDRRNRALAEERVGFGPVEELSELNGADQTAQAEAFDGYAKALGLNTRKSYSSGGSRYVEVDIGEREFKFRFADHFNTVRDSTMQPDFNVAPGRNDFTEAIDFLRGKLNEPISLDGGNKDQTETAAFKRWFGNSKVVDAHGKPLVLYHGTPDDFSKFDSSMTSDGGFHFGSRHAANQRLLQTLGEMDGDFNFNLPADVPTNIMPVYLSIKNPRTVDDADNVIEGPNWADVVAEAKALGYDGLRYYNSGEGGGISWVAFNPEQIKSATGNRGTFDASNPDIRYSRATTAAGTEPAPRENSPWRDSGGRLQFAPGKWLYEKFGPEIGGAVIGAATGSPAGPVGAFAGAVAGAVSARKLIDTLALKAASPELRSMLRKMKLEIENAKETAASVAVEGEKLSGAEWEMVSDIIEKEMKAGVVPPAHAVQLAASINGAIEKQTDEVIRLQMMPAENAERLRGQYLPRYYESKLGKTAKDAWADSIGKMFRTPSPMRGIKGNNLKGRGKNKPVQTDQVEQWESLGWKVSDPDFPKNTTAQDITKMVELGEVDKNERINMWRDFTRKEREDMGEIRDARFRFVMGYIQTQKDIAMGRLFEGIAGNTEMSSRTETEKFSAYVPETKVSGTGAKVYGMLAGRWVSPETLSQLSRAEEEGNNALHVYRKAMSLWKEGRTVLNPVAHANNVVSNITMAHLAGVSYWRPDAYIGTIRDFVKNSPMVKEAKEAGLFLGTMSDEELMKNMPEELRVLAQKQEGATEKIGRNVWNLMSFWLRKPMGTAYQAEDTFFRYLIYRDARSRGIEPDDAVDYAQKYIFNYDDLPKGARRIRDLGIPFFAYTYKAMPALLNTALTHPERLAAPAVVLAMANTVAYAIAADDDDDLEETLRKYIRSQEFRDKVRDKEKFERGLLPDWMKGHTALMTPKTIRLGNDELTNLPLFLDVSRMIPGGDLFDVNPNTGGIPLPQPITPNHPLITLFTGFVVNKDLFRGSAITDSNDTSAEKTAKRADWIWKQLSPSIAINNYHWERGMNALAQASGGDVKWIPDVLGGDATGIGRDGNPVQPGYAAMQTFGVKARPIDLDMAEQMDNTMRKKMINDIDAEVRKLRRLNNIGAIADRTFEAELEKSLMKKDRLREGLTVEGEDRN